MAGFKPAVLRDQPQPMLIWVKLDELVIDHRYQRDITLPGRKAIQRIADWFDWKKYQPILVAPSEGGRMAVVDGQHRTHAAALIGIEAIPAMTVPMTPAEQAEGLVSINRDRIRMSVHNTYRAELAAGAEWAILAKAAVEAGGCALATSNPSGATKKPGTVFAINLVRKMVMNGEAEVVTQGLRAIRTSESGSRVESYGGPVLAVWFSALAQNQRFLTLTVSIANSSDLVNGTGTQFVTNVAIGKMLVIDREVIGFVVEIISNVQLRLGRAYEGPAINDASYDLVNLGAVKDGIIDLLTALKSTF
ncbi:MAG: ParB/Srx family N-terminal domain-containing protein, partial [Roseovarius sp.]|nr:ParB/Srx family N-terminal domain-containing protein [Roseovarius sp.]